MHLKREQVAARLSSAFERRFLSSSPFFFSLGRRKKISSVGSIERRRGFEASGSKNTTGARAEKRRHDDKFDVVFLPPSLTKDEIRHDRCSEKRL